MRRCEELDRSEAVIPPGDFVPFQWVSSRAIGRPLHETKHTGHTSLDSELIIKVVVSWGLKEEFNKAMQVIF